jgi:hypothetical protein
MDIEALDRMPMTLDVERRPVGPSDSQQVDDHVFLIGRPPLQQFLDFVTEESAVKDSAKLKDLIADWDAANECVGHLEQEEGGWADHPTIGPLGRNLLPLHEALLEDPLFRHSFDAVPVEIGVVELDRLVVFQKHINLEHCRQLRRRLPRAPSEEEIFKFCLPFDHPQPPARWMRTHRDTFVFLSPSNDLRYLGAMSLSPENITGCPPPGNLVGVVGIAVGFGTNFLNVIHAEGRLVLNNGSHRAFTLREMGVTHVPCIVQHANSRETLSLIASSDLKRNPDRYLKHPRPSVLKDYFDPRLRKIVPVPRTLRQVRLKFAIDEGDAPAL